MNQNNDDISRPEMDYYLNEELCDVVFLVEGHRIPAPKQYLCVKNRVFRAMFSGNFIESEDKVIAIEDTTVEAFKTFIRFILCDQLVLSKDNDFELIGQVFRLSDKYQVSQLSNKVMDLIKPQINVQNLRSIARIAFNYNMDQLMTIINQFIGNNINSLIHRDIEELTEINDCTNDRLFEVLTSCRVRNGSFLVQLAYKEYCYFLVLSSIFGKCKFPVKHNSYTPIIGSFEALKVLIGFLYFNRLILKDKNDFKLIQELCQMAGRYSVNGLMNTISADLKNMIEFENFETILKLSFDFKIIDLLEKVFEFIQTNIEELVKKDVEEKNWKSKFVFKLIRDILNFIQRFKVSEELKERIAALLENYLTFDNLVIFYELAVDYNIEDLITNIKTFIEKNLKLISGKDMKELIEMNNSMNNTLFEVMAKHLANN